MDKWTRFVIASTFFVQLFVLIVVAVPRIDEIKKPKADKLTITVDNEFPIPPQIAYFIPDSAFNSTFPPFGPFVPGNFPNTPQPGPPFTPNGFNPNQIPVINMWPPNFFPGNRNPNAAGNFAANFAANVATNLDLDVEQQRQHDYLADVPEEQRRTFIDGKSVISLPNYSYQVDYAKIPDKEPDFRRFENFANDQHETIKRKSKKPIKQPISFNYANTTPNLRKKIKAIKSNHENKFDVTKDKQNNDSGSGSDNCCGDDASESEQSIANNDAKLRKSHRKKPHYISITKLSRPTSNGENESNLNANIDGNDVFKPKHTHHKDCDHTNGYDAESLSGINENDAEISHVQPKGYSIYLTKVIKHPKLLKNRRAKKKKSKSKSTKNGFVPTRVMTSVRRTNEIEHKPRKSQQPTIRERLQESGGHVVYTEDGYEDNEYDHGEEDKNLEYLSRSRRSTNVKDLKGQELIDHLDVLIRNVSDYLNSSEIVPNLHKKFPLYNSSDELIKESAIKYSEYAKPVVDENISSELYESKTDECDEIDEDIDLTNAHNETSGPKKRLGNLGNKLECLKKKLFGDEPLDNPIFQEDIAQPQPDKVFGNIMQESESIQTISSVYNDVMDNIKYNSLNENQRIFSDFGISDNVALGTIHANQPAQTKNELNISEKYPDGEKSQRLTEIPTVTQSPLLLFNPFTDPAQLPILDISRYIPTAKYTQTDSDYLLQTDFKPIISPYLNNNQPPPTSTTTAATTTTTTTSPTSAPPTQTIPMYGPVRQLLPPGRTVHYYHTNQIGNSLNVQNPNAQRVVLVKRRRPVALMRVNLRQPPILRPNLDALL